MDNVYLFEPNIPRALTPKILVQVTLGTLLYFALLLNLILANSDTTSMQLILVMMILAVILGTSMYTYHSVKEPYKFSVESISRENNSVKFLNINSMEIKRDYLDKIFHTHKLDINSGQIIIKHIPDNVDLYRYIQSYISNQRTYLNQTQNKENLNQI